MPGVVAERDVVVVNRQKGKQIMTQRAAIQVEEPTGPRWAAALEALRKGSLVQLGDVLVLGLEWHGPRAPDWTSPLIVEILAPPQWHKDMGPEAEHECGRAIRRAQDEVSRLAEEDSEFAELLGRREVRIEVVDDYSNGAVLKAIVDDSGNPVWV